MGGGGDFLPFLTMVLVQVGFAGMNILSKLAMDSGMNPLVHVAYRQTFGTVVIAPFAYFLERKTRPKMTLPILFQILLCSIFGATMSQTLYFVGLQNTTPTVACALSNLLPAVTFLLAIIFRLESVGIRRKPAQAKVLGTVVCVGGAMLLSFYQGPRVMGGSGIHWKYAEAVGRENSNHHQSNFILGPFLVIVSTVSWAVWFIIQAKLSVNYAAPYTTTTLICLMASIQCGIIGFCAEPRISEWSLLHPIRAVSSLYAGTVCQAVAFVVMTWSIQRKGPLYVSVFSPLLLVIVGILSWALLGDQLYVGTLAGSALIVMGLYAVLWGKNKETNNGMSNFENAEDEEENDILGANELDDVENPTKKLSVLVKK